ncbi:transferrin-binding protein-like solute binding protein [Spirabiliibacterium falconis]|uniref:transferrin-binding protein-like solute binding protein n=1 Tax=Spirabiliibacterium falconis TaxID=572023 RepID=UPI001AAD62A0|nr:transferrin-binding protein-like solute binding protein [Spirabiliibacterium falconis]MBE2894482.1 hypothetical protein [Spirabiliibacterium falconis]
MKKDLALKFTLTVAASVLLAACGSSGGDSNPEPAKPTAEQVAKQKAEAAAEAKAKAQAELDAKESKEPSDVGYKVVSKTTSDFIVDGRAPARNSEAGTAAGMQVQKPQPSFDTLIVAVPTKESKAVAYVEDFDFSNQASGLAQLEHIYINESTKNGVERQGKLTDQYGDLTKTNTQGTKTGKAYVYQEGRTDYTGDAGRIKKSEFNADDSVAEVYGRNTMSNDKDVNATRNLPLTDVKTNKYEDGHLQFVQYGRVTTQLDAQTRLNGNKQKPGEVYKEGVDLGDDIQTYVVDYSHFNAKNKEDNYFYRGINNTSAEKLKEFGYGKEGVLVYQGHAVTYGLDNKYHEPPKDKDALNAPTALRGLKPEDAPKLISGTHVTATVDLAKRSVTGELYNKFEVQKEKVKDTLVTFKGDLKANGNVKNGTSELAYATSKDRKEGTFNATLFGNDKVTNTELGGTVVSKNGDADKKWGAVFGAEYVGDKPVAKPAPKPAEPISPWVQKENQAL